MRNLLAMMLIVLAACGHHHGATSDGSGSAVIVTCPGCPTFPGPGSGSACAGGSAADPEVVYPPDGVLLPPNMNVIEVQFLPGVGNTIFEIDFENNVTDVRLETQCNMITNTRGSATGGCAFDLSPTDWNYVATQNAGGMPVTVTVRGAPANVSCVAPSANSRQIKFAAQPLSGGIYYWQSVTQGGVAGKTGGIYRKDFGNPDPTPEPFLTPGNLNKCVGCHYLSRDGLKMVFGDDDADSDDELGDDSFYLYNITAGSSTSLMGMAKGFAAWEGSAHTQFVLSNGGGMGASSPELLPFNGSSGAAGTAITFTASGLTGKRVTNPDWSFDGTTVYFTATTPITNIMSSVGNYTNSDDIHSTNGSIWSVPVSGTGVFGTPTPLVTAANAQENDYYAAIAPDDATLIFDKAIGTGSVGSGSNLPTLDSYNNPNAELYAMAVSGGSQVALTNANTDPNNPTATGLTNSWPRWSLVVQQYNGKHIVWVTFSSTRDYGLRVQNEGSAYVNCYPPVSPEDPSGDHTQPFAANCTQPQLWMTAITLEDIASGTDGSYPAFWLPFQDYTAHNHIAQWVQTVVTQSGCSQVGSACSTTQPCCNGETCDTTTMVCNSNIP